MSEVDKLERKENSFPKECHEEAEQLISICQDRTARSHLRKLLSGIPDLEIKAMKYMRDIKSPRSLKKKLIAGLIAEYSCDLPEEPLSFGTSLYQLSQSPGINPKGIERRLEMLLDLDFISLTQPLHSLVLQARQCKATIDRSKVTVDYGELLYHLHCWDSSEKWVQLRWAEDFWCRRDSKNKDSAAEKNDESIAVVK